LSTKNTKDTKKKQKLPLTAAQSFGDSLQIAIALNMFVLFVFFVDKYGFLRQHQSSTSNQL
jgi:hypothetical protein